MKQSRWARGLWLPACALATLVLWFGCEQKGDLSPTSTSRRVLTFIDTVVIDPAILGPGQSAAVGARILGETNEPVEHENVRFSVNRGVVGGSQPDTTVASDQLGWARTTVTAPADTGSILLRTELLSMAEMRSALIPVSSNPVTEGLLTVWAELDTLFADNGVSRCHIYARLRNENHNPIPNAVVYFSTTVGSVTSPAFTDSLTGTATSMLVSTTEVGEALVIGRYGSTSDSARVMFLAPAAASFIVMTSSQPQLTAGSDSARITARVFDANNLPVVDNTVVNFSTTGGVLSSLTGRTVSGVAATTLYAPSVTGPVTVTATTGGSVTGSVTISVIAGSTASIHITAADDTLLADNASQTTITALVTDAYSNPVAEGTLVSFVAQGGTVTASSTVGSDGRATALFQAGLAVGPAAVTASQGGVQAAVVIYLSPTTPASISLTVNPVQLVANGTTQATLRAMVLDAQNRPVSNGTQVTFSAGTGVISEGGSTILGKRGWNESHERKMGRGSDKRRVGGTDDLKLLMSPNSLYTATTLNGYAYATLTSPTTAGPDTVVASVQTLSDRRFVTYLPGDPARVQVTPQATELPADGVSSTPVVCQVMDAFGNAVGSGLQVNVTATLGRLSPTSGYTDADGWFVTNLLTTRQRGLCAIVATAEEATGYAEVVFTAPEVAAVGLGSDVSVLFANGLASAMLTAVAVDAYGLPVSGAPVNWSLSAGIGWLVPYSAMTDSLGHAAAVFYSGASRTDAQQNVTATIGDFSDTRVMRMLGVTMSAWTEVNQLPADGESTTPATVLVRETTSGLAISNATVRFAATVGTITQTAVTNPSGLATATYRSGTVPGPVEITTLYGDTLRAQALLRLTSIEAETLLVTLEQNNLLADGVSSTTVTAVVYNEGGQTVPNTPVTFTAVGPGSFFPTATVSDSNGVAVSTYRSAALTADQAADLEVAIERASDLKSLLLRGVTFNAAALETELPANGSSTTQIRVEVRETSSLVAIPNAVVQFGTNIGTIPASGITDSSGVATVTFTAGTDVGEATVIARFGDLLTDTVYIELFSPSAALVDLAASSNSILADGQATSQLSMLVLDQRGVPLRNALVQWSLIGAGTLTTTSSLTNATGVASNTFISSGSVSDGSTRVVAWAGSSSDTVLVHTRGVTLNVTAASLMIPANGTSTTQVQAHVRETTSLVGIPDVIVSFGASLGTITASSGTDDAGTALATLTSASTAGTSLVVARYGNLLTDTMQVVFYNPTPHHVMVASDTSILRADGVSQTLVYAWVYDELNVPMPGVTVTWSANSGLGGVVQTTTDTRGLTTVAYQSTASVSDRIVTVTALAGSASGATVITERGVTVDVTAVPLTVIADGNSTSQIRAHVYETTTSVGIPSVNVAFGTTLGTIPSSAETDPSGVATVNLRSSTQTGTATVEARFGNLLTDQVNVAFAPSTPTTLSLTAMPTVLLADNASAATLTAVVTDQNGNPVPNGTQIRFTIPPQGGSMENLRTTIAGVANNTLTSSSTPDTVQVTAWADANPGARDSVTVIYIVGPAAVVRLSAQRDTLAADGMAVDTVTAYVTDAVGHTLSNVEVRFQTTIGNITASRVTDGNGNAKVAFSSSQTGVAQIAATAGEAGGQYTIYLIPGLPSSISLAYFPSSVGVRGSGRNESLLITATVRDVNNNPVIDGTEVFFNINNSPGGGDFLSSAGPIPTINGQATVSYNSGTVAGSVRIRSTCDGVTAVSTEILIYAGPPFIEDIHNPCETTHMSLAPSPCSMFGMDVVGDSVVLVALIGDRYNNPVTPGTAVYFTTSGGVITTATGYTDSLGFAYVTLFSGHPLPSIARWRNTLHDPNLGTEILCAPVPPMPGVAKVLATSAGVDANGDSVMVWATTDVIFEYSQPLLYIREVTVNGDPDLRTLYIGENALIRIGVFDPDYWPLVASSTVQFTATHGMVYPPEITIGCPGDTTYTASFFNNLGITDDDASSPVLIIVDTRQGDTYAFTETFTLRASLPPTP